MAGASYWGPETIIFSTNGDAARRTPMAVRDAVSGILVALYGDPDRIDILDNPVKTDEFGNLAFYIDPGTYLVSAVGSTYSFRIVVGAESGGGGGGGETFEFVQAVAQSVWTVNHNLGRRPASVSVFSLDLSDQYDEFTVQHVTINQLMISMDQPTAGRALM